MSDVTARRVGRSFYNGLDPTWPYPDECYVYLIGNSIAKLTKGFLKVGISYNPVARLKNIQTSCPFPVEILLEWWLPTRAAAMSVEREFHENYRPERSSGEWFLMRAGDAAASLDVIAEPHLGLVY